MLKMCLDRLTEMYEPKKTIPTSYEFTDIAGLVRGASKGEGLGNKFLITYKRNRCYCRSS